MTNMRVRRGLDLEETLVGSKAVYKKETGCYACIRHNLPYLCISECQISQSNGYLLLYLSNETIFI